MAVCLKADRLHIDGQAAEPTDSNIEPGDIYYNTTEDTLYRRDQNNEWVAVGGGAIEISNTEHSHHEHLHHEHSHHEH